MKESKGDSEREPPLDQGEWNRIVDAASEHARERTSALARAEAPPARGNLGWALGILTLLLLAVCSWNVHYFLLAGEPSPEFEEAALKASVYLAWQAVENSWEETGSIPASLEEVGADEEGLAFRVTASGYTLTATGEHYTFTFDRGGNLDPFEAAFRSLLAGEVER